ncbi:MAG: low molecular weight phosphotyrosine protein phosphatase [Bacteroidales bacterium]|nr:low molecular weight phosphotyrosine protein phosphatase [Bacteroidales bacterium]
MNVLFVCLGNTCRSPMAEGILKKIYQDKGITGAVESAGFQSFQHNNSPDPRAISVAKNHGIDICPKKARIFHTADFDRFDRIFVMDTKNMNDVLNLVRDENDRKKVDYLMNAIEPGSNKTVPDPYLNGVEDYEKVFINLEKACHKIAHLTL